MWGVGNEENKVTGQGMWGASKEETSDLEDEG